ncbi:MAG: YigZ family protein [Methylovulum sp.]|nr:YigZ family protein [Methylovulum sp.]
MNCVQATYTLEDMIKKSRFIGIITPCADENEALLTLKQLHGGHPDASHIVYAYQIKTENGLLYRFNDAGEPTGTAGKPIFQQLAGKNLVNVLLAVIRYFGGIKLGAGGLTRAYGNTAKHVIDGADIRPYIEWANIPLTLDYKQMQAFEYTLKKLQGRIVAQDFAEQIRLRVELPIEHADALRQSFPGLY